MRDLKLVMSEGVLFQCWTFFFFYATLATIFGSMFENKRLFICGLYVMFDLAIEFMDFALCWYERR